MSRASHIATAKRVVGSDQNMPSSGNGESEDKFMKKINKWSERDRSNWTYANRPNHRNLTIGATISQGALLNKNASDLSALQGLEDSLNAMGNYIKEGNQGENLHAADITSNMADVQDLLRIHEQSRQKAKVTVANVAALNKVKGPMFTIDETPDSPGMYRPIKPFDPDNLESVRRHNQFLEKKSVEQQLEAENERAMHNFHALPMPGHVPFADLAEGEDGGVDDAQADATTDSLSDFMASIANKPETAKAVKERKERITKPPRPAGNQNFQAFFVTEGDNAAGESSSEADGSFSSNEESNDDDIDAELAELSKKEEELLKKHAKLSRERNRAAVMQTDASVTSLAESHITPRLRGGSGCSSAQQTPRSASRRPTSTDVLLTEATGGIGPSILDLDQKEREVLFKLKKEQKLRELKREVDLQQVKNLQRAPNTARAQESWRRAKEEHQRETMRQLQHEEMKQKLADMQEEMRILRLEQKVNELRKVTEQKVLQDKLRGMVEAGISSSTATGGSVKLKKKKRKRMSLREEKNAFNSNVNSQSVFAEDTSVVRQENSLAEDPSLLGLMTDSMVQDVGNSSSAFAAEKGVPKKTRRNRLPPRGPNLSYSQFEAQETIHEDSEEGEGDRKDRSSSAIIKDMSALDLLSEEPGLVDDRTGKTVTAARSFANHAGRRRPEKSSNNTFAEPPVSNLCKSSTITYESEADMFPESRNRQLEEGISMFSIEGNNVNVVNGRRKASVAVKSSCSCRDTPTKRIGQATKVAVPSPYGVDLAAAYDERQHQGAPARSNRKMASAGDSRAARVPRSDSRLSELYGQQLNQLDGSLFVQSPTRSRPKLREYSSPHRHIFDNNERDVMESRPVTEQPCSPAGSAAASSPGPPTLGNRPGWSEAEPDVSDASRKDIVVSDRGIASIGGSEALSMRRSDASGGVRSSRASTDLYLSDSESVVSYDANGKPYTVPATSHKDAMQKNSAIQQTHERTSALATPFTPLEPQVVKDPRYCHIDIYQNSNIPTPAENSGGYTFLPRHKNEARQEYSAPCPGSANKMVGNTDPKELMAERPGSSSASRGDTGERFFDSSSTQDKGRFRVNDARDFHTKSMHRRPDTLDDGVTLLLGVRRTHNNGASGSEVVAAMSSSQAGAFAGGEEEVITVLFDRVQFSEDRARAWWQLNKERILNISKFQ